ncbi:DNA ligase, partial [Exophiala viscosa]
MAFKFVWLVELFEALEAARKDKALTTNRNIDVYAEATNKWFDKYEHKLQRTGPSAIAFLSCILPERLPQRTYRVQEDTLVKIFCRVLHLGHTSSSALRRWHEQDADFATTVEHTMANSHLIMSKKLVTLEDIDKTLLQLADKGATNTKRLDEILTPVLRHLTPPHTKWLVRMILKSYTPIHIPEATVLQRFHFLLPDLLAVQNSFDAAVEILEHDNIKALPYNPVGQSRDVYLGLCAAHIRPKLGVMITRTQYEKARSIKHCCDMARQRHMSVERKYDGEYCQIHVDRSKPRGNQIQIFSKSGKDSTTDRVRLHGVIEAGLRLDREDCGFDRNCIVDGELVVYSRTQKTILPFHKIRKHVMHGGTFIGTAADSPRKGDEQLMIVFYDILLLDDKILAKEPQSERRKELERIVRNLDGEAQIAYRQIINFGVRDAKVELREFFECAILQRWEGLVLKGCRDPYFSWESSKRVIKLKKDYIHNLGDTVDLCIIGGRRSQIVVDQLGIGPLSWTTFYIACIENKEQVRRHNKKPVFRIIDTVSIHGISKDNIRHLNGLGEFLRIPFADHRAHMEVQNHRKNIQAPTDLFKSPIVVDVMGAGFEKPQNAAYYVLRFPRIVKLQRDRSFLDSSTFADLQEHADRSMKVSLDDDEQQEEGWIERLIAADGKNAIEAEGNQSQTTASPVQSTPG